MYKKFDTSLLDEWLTAQSQLGLAMTCFLEASTTLYRAIDSSYIGSVDRLSIEDVTLQVHSRMDLIGAIEGKMTESRAIIHRVLNTSATLAPINILPPEILSHVFALTAPPSAQLYKIYNDQPLHPLDVIPCVCTRWRRLAISTRSLWSSIHINNGYLTKIGNTSMLRRSELWLERASGASLDIHIREEVEEDVGDETELLVILQPHLSRVASLTLWDTSYVIFKSIINLVTSYGTPGTLTALTVANVLFTSVFLDPEPSPARFAWSVNALQGLTELKLADMSDRVCPTLDDLVAVLLNSPSIRTLHLNDLIIPPGHTSEYPRIDMPNLRNFKIGPVHRSELVKLLSLLLPSKSELEVELTIHWTLSNNKDFTVIREFLTRSNITVLSLQKLYPNHSHYVASFLDCVPHLKILTLDLSMDKICINLGALTVQTEGEKTIARLPHLQTLRIVGGSINSLAQQRLKNLVECYSLDEIELDNDSVVVQESFEDLDVDGLLAWLQQRIKNVIYDSAFHSGTDS